MNHKDILSRYSISPKKSLGQNFLVNDGILEKISQSIDINGKNVIEVGPGYGALTMKLLEKHPKRLDLIELDSKMADIIEDRIRSGDFDSYDINLANIDKTASGFKAIFNSKDGNLIELRLFNIDVLRFDPEYEDYYLVANIPYYITSPILFRFLFELKLRPKELVILMQKDVGDKILKRKPNKDSVLSLYIELSCSSVKEITRVSAGSFVPPPKVESSVLHFISNEAFDKDDSSDILKLIKIGFSEKRKMLLSNLSKGLKIDKKALEQIFDSAGLDYGIRAEDVGLANWGLIHLLIAKNLYDRN